MKSGCEVRKASFAVCRRSNEEFATLLTQIESCLNSRSISSMSDDYADLSPLTPAHLLIGSSLIAIFEKTVDFEGIKAYSLATRATSSFDGFGRGTIYIP